MYVNVFFRLKENNTDWYEVYKEYAHPLSGVRIPPSDVFPDGKLVWGALIDVSSLLHLFIHLSSLREYRTRPESIPHGGNGWWNSNLRQSACESPVQSHVPLSRMKSFREASVAGFALQVIFLRGWFEHGCKEHSSIF